MPAQYYENGLHSSNSVIEYGWLFGNNNKLDNVIQGKGLANNHTSIGDWLM